MSVYSSIKEDVACYLCKMVSEEPMTFPCGCLFCLKHLNDHFLFTCRRQTNKSLCIWGNDIHHAIMVAEAAQITRLEFDLRFYSVVYLQHSSPAAGVQDVIDAAAPPAGRVFNGGPEFQFQSVFDDSDRRRSSFQSPFGTLSPSVRLV